MTGSASMDEPDVSFAIASYNSAPFLAEAVASALGQRDIRCEVLIVDDGSSDGSLELAHKIAADEPRVRVFSTPANGGPAAARNIAIEAMRGQWFAVLDSDDTLEPARSRNLLDLAVTTRADMVADDLTVFSERDATGTAFLGDGFPPVDALDLQTYFEHSRIYGAKPNLGFLKPMIRRSFLAVHAIRYDEEMRIGEDDRLVIACLLAGARYAISNVPGYRYRKHDASISHRLRPMDAAAMVEANRRIGTQVSRLDAGTRQAFAKRSTSYANAAAFARAIEAMQQGRPIRGLLQVANHPGAAPLFMMPIRSRLSRFRKSAAR